MSGGLAWRLFLISCNYTKTFSIWLKFLTKINNWFKYSSNDVRSCKITTYLYAV